MFYFSRIKIKHFLSTPLKFKHFRRPVSTLFQFNCWSRTSVRLREAQKLLARSTCEYFPIFYQRPVLAFAYRCCLCLFVCVECQHPGGALPSESVGICRLLDPLLFTSGSLSGWVFKCQTYSCWALFFFHVEPLSLGNICEIFIFSHSFGVIFVEIWYSGWDKFTPR